MLLRVIFCCCLFAAYYSAAAPTIASATTDLLLSNASVPEKLAKFYFSLSADERSALSAAATKINEGNVSIFDNRFFDILKESSADLFARLTGIKDILNSALNKLSPEGRAFMGQLIRRFLAIFAANNFSGILDGFKGFGKEALSMYDTLPETTRQNFLSQFPTIGGLLTSDLSRLMLSRLSDFSVDLSKIIDAILPSRKNTTAKSVPDATPAPAGGQVLPDTPSAGNRIYPDIPSDKKTSPDTPPAGRKSWPSEPASNKIYPDVPAEDKVEEEIKKVTLDTS